MYSFLDAAHTVMRSVFSLNHLHNVQLLPVKLLLWLLLWEANMTLKGTFSSLSWSWSKQLSELSPIMTHALLSPALNLSTVQTLQDTVTRHCRILWPDTAGYCDQTLQDNVTRLCKILWPDTARYCDQNSAGLQSNCRPVPVELTAAWHKPPEEVLLFQILLRYLTERRRFGVPSLLLLLRLTRAVWR